MSNYYKPWLIGRETKKPDPPSHPLDKIRCYTGQRRYVVACMRNCPKPRYCREFWGFFEERDQLPPDYYNDGGIGDLAMRRIVIDCDRCGKKDIEEVFALYRPEGEGEEFLLPEETLRAMVESCGYPWDSVGPLVIATLQQLEGGSGWVHFCRRCFQQSTEWLAKILQVKAVPALKQRAKSGEPAAEDVGEVEPAAEVEAPAEEPTPVRTKKAPARKTTRKKKAAAS